MSDNAPKDALTNPFALSTDDGYTWLKGNLHSHTTNSGRQGRAPRATRRLCRPRL